jgi:Transposase DDE domain
VIDSQSVKTNESGDPRGYDAGKKVKGRKRQVMVDTDGRGLILEVQPANIQDRDGAPVVLRLSRRSFPFITMAFADMGFAGDGPANATSITIGDRQEAHRSGRVCGSSTPLGGREVFRLAQPQPTALEGPGEPRSHPPEPSYTPRP